MSNRRTAELSKPQPEAGSPASSRSDTSSNSKAPSSGDQLSPLPKAQVDFQFLNFSHPSDAKRSQARRAVRSHVTRHQHQKEQAAALARRNKNTLKPSTSPETTSLSSSSTAAEPQPKLNIPASASGPPSTLASEASSASPSPSVSPTRERRIEPAEVYPEEWHAHIPNIMEFYMMNMSLEIPDRDEAETRMLLRTRFFNFVLSEPALLHTVLLMAVAYHQSVFNNGRSSSSSSSSSRTRTTASPVPQYDRQSPNYAPIDLFHLRGMAIREINRALADPIRATSDQVLVAVAKMGAWEALYGDRGIFNTHMTGLMRMVSLRGGLPSLGLDGLLVRILLWIDANSSAIAGVGLYFDPKAFTSPYRHPEPQPHQFPGPLIPRTQLSPNDGGPRRPEHR